ncbi:hypothetical protein BCL57_000958 [Agromyces flavus]|uniref:Uncharacterized protein n=1 Tax=Agromyces flavus TaxID=589382 RepID=A0ABT1KIX2_9MICO|nr:hypothetical protein [Agromyces flavus]MCP2366816.1 hypothetical protein [Agromyces flavus]
MFVYADGRVLIHPDTASGITEMQLSTAGIEAVRSGEVPADSFVVAPWTIPTSAWANSVAREYSSDLSAVCPDAAATQAGTLPALQDRLPTAVRRILAGTITTFAADPYGIGMAPNLDGAVECWILTRSQSIAVWEQSRGFEGLGGPDGEFVSGRHDQGQWGTLIDPDGSWIGFNVEPVLPHGGFVFWGG